MHGYNAVCPNLYWREAPGASPDDAAATARAAGGVPDERLVGDVGGAVAYLRAMPNSNGKAGTIGYCSGGRQSFLAAVSLPLDAAVDCYGAFVVGKPPEGMPLKVGPIVDQTPDLSCPLLGLFGAEDSHPSPEQVAELEKALVEAGKAFEFHSYEGAGHAFFAVNRPAYRPEAANDGGRRSGTSSAATWPAERRQSCARISPRRLTSPAAARAGPGGSRSARRACTSTTRCTPPPSTR